jgi:hypothetical protein
MPKISPKSQKFSLLDKATLFAQKNPNATTIGFGILGASAGFFAGGPVGAVAGFGAGLEAGRRICNVANKRAQEINLAQTRESKSHNDREKSKSKSQEEEKSQEASVENEVDVESWLDKPVSKDEHMHEISAINGKHDGHRNFIEKIISDHTV